MITEVTLAINAIILTWFIHSMHCIKHAVDQRRALIALISRGEPFMAIKQLNAMSGTFDAHLRRVLFLRNPWVIYPSILHPLIEQLS